MGIPHLFIAVTVSDSEESKRKKETKERERLKKQRVVSLVGEWPVGKQKKKKTPRFVQKKHRLSFHASTPVPRSNTLDFIP